MHGLIMFGLYPIAKLTALDTSLEYGVRCALLAFRAIPRLSRSTGFRVLWWYAVSRGEIVLPFTAPEPTYNPQSGGVG